MDREIISVSDLSHVLIVKRLINHYRWFDHRSPKRTNPALFFLVGLRVEVESRPSNVQLKAEFFVYFVVSRLHCAADLHFNCLSRVGVLTLCHERQQKVFCKNRISSESNIQLIC